MNIEGINVFPLSKVLGAHAADYYIDSEANIYSTKRGGIRKLKGSVNSSGRRYFTPRYYGEEYGDYYVDDVYHCACNHDDWEFHVSTYGDYKNHVTAPGRVLAGIENRGNVIAKVENGQLVFGEKPVIHLNEDSWRAEIERLANSNPGVTFVSLKIEAALTSGGLVWS